MLTYPRRVVQGEIRLLQIADKTESDAIICNLTYHRLVDKTKYVALSYAWGFIDVSHPIECDGQKVLVSRSVHAAVMSLLETNICGPKGSPVWIDSLCINQADNEEKTSQVRLLQDIYTTADHVVGWLGQETEGDRRAFRFLSRLHRILNTADVVDVTTLQDTASILYVTPEDIGESCELSPAIANGIWRDVGHVLMKPWFGRMWIIQEYVFARKFSFLCGHTLIDPAIVFTPIKYFNDYDRGVLAYAASTDDPARNKNVQVLHIWKTCAVNAFSETDTSETAIVSEIEIKTDNETRNAEAETEEEGGDYDAMLTCLLSFTNFKASDPRDRAFAPAAICGNECNKLIDYSQDLDQVLINTARTLLSSNIVGVLSCSQAFGRVPGLPTWVPCWLNEVWLPTPVLLEHELGYGYGNKTGTFEIAGSDTLLVSCRVFDQIRVTSSLWPTDPLAGVSMMSDAGQFHAEPGEALEWAVRFLKSTHGHLRPIFEAKALVDQLTQYPSGLPPSEVFWRSLALDPTHSGSTDVAVALEAAEMMFTVLESYPNWDAVRADLEAIYDSYRELPRTRTSYSTRSLFLSAAVGAITSLFTEESFPSWKVCLLSGVGYLTSTIILALRRAWKNNTTRSCLQTLLESPAMAQADKVLVHPLGRMVGRRLCISRNGYVVWAPKTAEIDDKICYLVESTVPFVVRPINKPDFPGPPCYEMIGDAYVHGLTPCEDAERRGPTVRIV